MLWPETGGYGNKPYLRLLDVTLLEDLLDNLFLLVCSELVFKLAVRGAIEDAGGTLPVQSNEISLGSRGTGGVGRAEHVDTYLWVTKIFQPLTT